MLTTRSVSLVVVVISSSMKGTSTQSISMASTGDFLDRKSRLLTAKRFQLLQKLREVTREYSHSSASKQVNRYSVTRKKKRVLQDSFNFTYATHMDIKHHKRDRLADKIVLN